MVVNEKEERNPLYETILVIIVLIMFGFLSFTGYVIFIDQSPAYFMTHPNAVMYCHPVFNKSDCYQQLERQGNGYGNEEYCSAVEECIAKERGVTYASRSLGYCRAGDGWCPSQNQRSITVNINMDK